MSLEPPKLTPKRTAPVSKYLMVRRLAICGVAVLIAAFLCLTAYVHILRHRAESMVRTAYELSEQQQLPTLAELRQRYGDKLKRVGCHGTDCGYTVTLSNGFLAALGIAPYTELQSSFWVRGDVVQEHMLDYLTSVGHRYNVVAHIQTDFCESCRAFAIDPWTESSPWNSNGMVEIGIKSTSSSRPAVFALNTRCLTQGGCNSVADLLPTVWAKTADERIACKIQTDKGWVQRPAPWWP
jgi:hypothetical protein